MNTDYSKYKTDDFLTDDKFVSSMLNPTEENMAFWKSLTDEDKVDINEFISAYTTLKSLHEQAPEVPLGRVDALWNRIQSSNTARATQKKRVAWFRYSAMAASIMLVIGLSIFSYLQNNTAPQSLLDYANNAVTEQPMSKYIELITNNESLSLVGTHADVEYGENGILKVNKETISSPSMADGNTNFNQLRVPFGKRAFLTLSDGTELWVNVGTVVSFPVTFANNIREIFVDGEVYANVSHDASRPFVIRTNALDVRVLGTSFNLSAYKDQSQTNVVLVNGSVNVQPKDGEGTIIKPNQMYAYSNRTAKVETVDVEKYTSWHEGNLIFQNETIESILMRLSRYYNARMKFPDKASGITFSGKLELKDDLTQMLNGLSQITDMTYTVKDSLYIMKFNN